MPRNTIAWILLLGTFAPSLQLSAEQLVGAAWSFQTEHGDVAAALRLAGRGRVRLPGRPPAVAPLALGRRRRRGELRFHDRLKLFDPEAVSRRRTRTSGTPSSATASASSSSTPASGSRSALGLLASLFAARPRGGAPLPPLRRDRAAADAVAGLGGLAHTARDRARGGGEHLPRRRRRRRPSSSSWRRTRAWSPRSGSRSCATGCMRSSGWSTARSSTSR